MSDIFRIATNVPALQTLFVLQGINDKIEAAQSRIATGKIVNKEAVVRPPFSQHVLLEVLCL